MTKRSVGAPAALIGRMAPFDTRPVRRPGRGASATGRRIGQQMKPMLRQLVAVPAAPAAGRRTGAGIALVRAGLIAGLVAYTVHSLGGGGADSGFYENWLYDGLLVVAAAL